MIRPRRMKVFGAASKTTFQKAEESKNKKKGQKIA